MGYENRDARRKKGYKPFWESEDEEESAEEVKKEDSGVFSKLRELFSGGDPALRGASRVSEEALKRELEARKKKEDERKKRGY